MPLARMQGTSMKAIAAGVMAIMAGAASAQGTERPAVERIGQPMLGEQRLPFSSAVRVGDLLILTASCPRASKRRRGRRWRILARS
jgi:hypothetical protein